MEKKLYYQLSDNADVSGAIMHLSGCMEWIKGDMEGVKESDEDEREYTITPIWLTEEEFDNLPDVSV